VIDAPQRPPKFTFIRLALIAVAVAVAVAVFLVARGRPNGSCQAGNPDTASPVADRALYAGIPEVMGTSALGIDMVRGETLRGRRRIAVEGGALVAITGWAVDFAAKRAASVVLVRVDDRSPVLADTCGYRPDVATLYGGPSYARSGFSVRLQPASGVHRVTFSVLSDDRRTLHPDARSLELEVRSPAHARTVPAVQGGFTLLDGAPVPAGVSGGAPFPHRAGSDLRINGWMIDRTSGTPAAVRSIDVFLDGRFVRRAAYGAPRPDVADYVHAPGVRNAGFTARLLTDGIPPGRHRVTLRAVVADGRQAAFGTILVLDLTRAPGG
jgi:hypothetical protein